MMETNETSKKPSKKEANMDTNLLETQPKRIAHEISITKGGENNGEIKEMTIKFNPGADVEPAVFEILNLVL